MYRTLFLQMEFNLEDQETEVAEDGEDDNSDIIIHDDVLDLDLAKMDQSSEEVQYVMNVLNFLASQSLTQQGTGRTLQ